MTETPGHQPDLPTLEHGRYRVLGTPDGGMVILRTADTCETCEHCGCGEKREPIGPVDKTTVDALQLAGQGKIREAMQLLMSRGFPTSLMKMATRRG